MQRGNGVANGLHHITVFHAFVDGWQLDPGTPAQADA